MRLTLRTLLAYLNDTLEPTQAREIGQKVNESEYAAGLVKRIQEVVRKRRLTAPELSGPDIGLGPNTVAEYLDNTLTPVDVTKVEKFCLESDLHLAELASVDQIRTLALCEPVDVESSTKKRMYDFVVDVKPVDSLGDITDSEQDTLVVHKRKEVPVIGSARPEPMTVPEFPTTPVWKRVLPYACFLLIGGAWLYLMVKDYGQSNSQNGVAAVPAVAPSDPNPVNLAATNPVAESALTADPVNGSSRPLPTLGSQATDSDNTPGDLDNTTPAVASTGNTPNAAIPNADGSTDTASENSSNVDTKGAEPNMVDAGEPVPDTGSVPEPTDATAANTTAPNVPATDANPATPETDTVAQGQRPSLPGMDANAADAPDLMHREASGVLIAKDQESLQWVTRTAGSTIKTWERFAIPEPFRGRLEPEDSGVRFDVLGGTNTQYLGESQSAPYGLNIQHGRVVVMADPTEAFDADATKAVSIAVRGRIWRVELLSAETTCGIEIKAILAQQFETLPDGPGFDGRLYVAEGSVRVVDSAGKAIIVQKLESVSLSSSPSDDDAAPPAGIRSVPDWVTSEMPTMSSATKQYARLIEKGFIPERRVVNGISPFIQDRKPQLAELATRCLATIEDAETLSRALAESDHEESRQAAIDGLRRFLTLSADNGEIVKTQLSEFFHDNVRDDVYRLLWGFNTEDASGSEASRELVLWLDDDNPTIRQLAFNYVRELTGKTNQYGPMKPVGQRKRAYSNWMRQLERDGALITE